MLAVIRDARGDSSAYEQLQGLGTDGLDTQAIALIDEAQGWHALLDGRMAEAGTLFRRGAASSTSNASSQLALAAHAALWNLDASEAGRALAAINEIGIHGRAVDNARTTMRAGLVALDGHHGEAITLYREALRIWRELGLRFDEALTGIDMSTLLPSSIPEVSEATIAAREILTDLGATAVLNRLEAAIARESAAEAKPQADRRSKEGAIGSQVG